MIYRYHNNKILGNSRFFHNQQKKIGHSFFLPKESGNQQQIKNKLLELFSDKCAYCETKEVSSIFPEHNILLYRPPIVTDHLDRDYKWLSWQWPNMLYVCPVCNQNRNERFEIKGKQAAKDVFNIDELQKEMPLLLNPCFVNPANYYIYEYGNEGENEVYIKANPDLNEFEKECANYSVEVLALNRDPLLKARAKAWEELVNDIIKNADSAQSYSASAQNLSNLISVCEVDKEFAGAKRYFLQKWLDDHERETKGSEWLVLRDQLKEWREETAVPPQPYPPPSNQPPPPPPSKDVPEIDLAQIIPYLKDINHENYFQTLRSILKKMFSEVDEVIIKGAFNTGFSGAQLYHIRTKVGKRAKNPCVVKIDLDHKIDKEYANGKKLEGFVRNTILPNGTVVRSGVGLSGIQYPLGRDRKTDIMSFKQYIRLSRWENIQRFIDEDLFPTMDDFWSKSKEGEFRWHKYDFLLPANLEVKYDSEIIDFVELSAGNWQEELTQVKIDTNIKLSGFKIVEIENDEIILNLPNETLRIKIIFPEGTTINRDVLQSKKAFLGKVINTRQSIILEKLHKAYKRSGFDKFDSDSPKITLPGNIQVGNPLSKLSAMLNYRSDVNTSPVHGDLNLENILVEYSPPPEMLPKGIALIDFATVREEDHVLHDFLRLETSIWLYIVSEELEKNNLTEQVVPLFHAVHQRAEVDNVFASLKSYHILRTIRQKVDDDRFLMRKDGWDEYFRGLTLYMLGALKYDNLDELQTAPSPKLLAFWVACLANHYVENV